MWRSTDNKDNNRKKDDKNIQGFDIDLNDESLTRIDRLVDEYESEIVRQLNSEYVRQTKAKDRISDYIARFGGSWRFIILFGVFLALWIVWNVIGLTGVLKFDKPPFILLNLCLSFIAAFQAPFIMMSQNRSAARDKRESIIDFSINYKAGEEIDDIQARLERIESEIGEIKELLQQKQE
ncbi:DUF1003 domain-containing protein [Sporolactobacillus pectinivorans]|uniref:DUF1003 domain-containing protein n=1 Tax=Sporolactobacillus pectinivorans TaxID=1591408 RepID=UPI000C268941|nr:DUF1003 domain-containing protein [Sporolactobacillus pectinivorans]